jgi:hypothetical protein
MSEATADPSARGGGVLKTAAGAMEWRGRNAPSRMNRANLPL